MNKTVSSQFCQALYEHRLTNETISLCCGHSFDEIKHWLPTPAGSYAIQRCPANISDILYNTNENATRYCMPNGIWENRTDYEKCIFKHKISNILIIWFCGYSISAVTLLAALILLRYFRALRCLRNQIHSHLIMSFILRVFIWYLNLLPQMVTTNWSVVMANIAIALHLFSTTANYFWMFVEGFYLFTVIVWTYSVEKYNICHYSLIGWGIPFILTTIAIVAICFTSNSKTNWLQVNSDIERIKLIVVHIPIFISIIINVLIMAFIIYTLIKKLKESKRPLSRNSNKFTIFSIEYKKAIKAAVVLIPLLGIAHCLVLFKPTIKQYQTSYQIISALLMSTQGFFVALIYCFLNREVRSVLTARYRSCRGQFPSSSSNSRMKQTPDDSIGLNRSCNSIFKIPIPNDRNPVFQCRNHRLNNSNSDGTLENPSIIQEVTHNH